MKDASPPRWLAWVPVITAAGLIIGALLTIGGVILTELYERLVEAIAAIARGNTRAAAVKLERSCVSAILSTGVTPPGCPTPN